MPYARASRKPRTVRRRRTPAKKTVYKKKIFKRTYPKKTYAKRYVKGTFSKPRADFAGAKFLAATTGDSTGMYRHMNSMNRSGLSTVKVHKKTVPDVFKTKFVAMTNALSLVPAAPVAFYGNSIVDCFRTSDSQNAAYVPELGALYLEYIVSSSKIQLHMRNISGQDDLSIVLFKTIVPPASWATGLPTTLDGWVTTSIPHKIQTLQIISNQKHLSTMSDFCTTAGIFAGQVDLELFSGLMPNTAIGQVGSAPSPNYQWYWGVTYFNYDGSPPSPSQVEINATIEYWTKLYVPVTSDEYTPLPEPQSVIPKVSFQESKMDESVYEFIKVKKGGAAPKAL